MSGVWPGGPPIPVQQGRPGQPFQGYQYPGPGPGPGQPAQEQQHQQQQGFSAPQGGFPTQGPPKAVPSGGAGFPIQRGGPQYALPPSGPPGGAITQSSPPMGSMPQSIPSAASNAASPHTTPPMYRSSVPGPGPGSALSNRPVAASAAPSSHPGNYPMAPMQQQQYTSPPMGGPPSVPGGGGIGPSPGRPGAPGPYQQLSHPNIFRPSSQPAPSMGPPPTGAPPPGPPPTGPPLSGPPLSGPAVPHPSGSALGPPPTAVSASVGHPRPQGSPFMAPPGPPPVLARGGPQPAGPPTTTGATGSPARYPGLPQQPSSFLSAPGAAAPNAQPSTGGSSPPLGASSFDQRGYLQAGPYGPSLVQTPPSTVSRALSQPPPQYSDPYATAAPSAGPYPTAPSMGPYGQPTSAAPPSAGSYGQPTSAAPLAGPYGQPTSAAPSAGPYGQPTPAATSGGPYGQPTSAAPSAGPYGQQTSAVPSSAGPYGQQPTPAAPSAGPYGQPTSTGTAGGGYYQGAGQYGYGPMQRQALIEEFQSLSITPPPGSLDAGVDPSLLPRPLDDEDSLPQNVLAANCHPKFMRLTCNAIPNSQSLRARWHLPLGAFIHPLAKPPPGEEVPIVNFGSVIVRCRSCRTYINPFVNFTDGGRRWRCNICGLLNEVPAEYFCQLGPDGRRRDVNERPELLKGCVEFVAPQEYMVRAPMPPVYFFLIDVSQPAVVSGMLQIAVDTIKASLDNLPGDIRVQIGFLTFDSTLHFINLKASLSQPQVLVVADLEDPFLPIPDDLLVNLSESRNVVEALLTSLPSMYQNTTNIESALGPALQVTYSVMSQLGGKLLVFQSGLPSIGVGRLKLRGDDHRIYGTDREHFLRVAEDQFYKRMAADCYRVQISVNMYCFSDRYSDIASLGTLAKYTGGQVFYYPAFFAMRDGERFSRELTKDLVRETGWEAVMRIRCGKGLRISSYHGHFFIRSSDLLALPAVDSDKACVVQIGHDDTILSTPTTYLQSALLYTASCGERRIRVHTSAVPVVDNLGDLYRAVDLGATVTALAKVGVERSYTARLEEVRTMIQQKYVAALREYRSLYSMQHHTAGRLIFPETLRLLPLYVLALCKSPALRGGFMEVAADERSFVGYELMTMSVERTLRLLYPTLRRVDDMSAECGTTGNDGKVILPPALTPAAEKLDPHGAYLMEDGLKMFLWIGVKSSSAFLEHILEPETVGEADNNMVLQRKENNVSKRLMAIVDSRREGMVVHPPCIVVRPGDRWENVVQQLLVEDRTAAGPSYMEWILSVHKQVQHKG